jgi:hypothetical protein
MKSRRRKKFNDAIIVFGLNAFQGDSAAEKVIITLIDRFANYCN